ncbi:MAG: amidohydrolase/deacetylase family metallohydrolase [Candidatus Solibacter usitatus]|nr:amidohydrolase/deacetylase family metallohydrolase [Candidatus Solibacter usitatus]
MTLRFLLLASLTAATLFAQTYDLLIQGGHVIDPANNIDAVRDVAVRGGVIARVTASIPASEAKKVLSASGLYVTPGLIDLHFHSFGYSGSIDPDDTALVTGTTTVVDAGGPGYRTFDRFRKSVVEKSKTRVLALINIAGNGMTGSASEDNVADMLPQKTADTIKQNRDVLVGIKVAHFAKPGWDALKRGVEAGNLADVPLLVDDKIFTNAGRTSREKLLDVMRPGDMHTHMYNDRQVEIVSRFDGKVQPYAVEARRRGVLFDMGHGGGSFLWTVAVPATRQGFYPDTISTDLHSGSIMIQQSDMPNCMSKMMLLGMSLPEAVRRSTMNPAKAIRRLPELGTLGEGKTADIALLAVRDGVFAFKDAWGAKMMGTRKVEAMTTIRNGLVAFDGGRPAVSAKGEIYDLLIRNGMVSAGTRVDIGVAGGKIVKMAAGLPASHARRVIDAGEYSVKAGLTGPLGLKPGPYSNFK